MKTKRLFLVCIASLAFVACGGDGGNDNDDGLSPALENMIDNQVDKVQREEENRRAGND